MPEHPRSEPPTVTCPYLAYPLRSPQHGARYIRLPLVHAYLASEAADTETIALVDSGATQTLLPREIGDILDLQYEDKVFLTEGAGGRFDTKPAKLKVLQLLKRMTAFTTWRNASVLVPVRQEVLPYMILGRDLVFGRFDITFHEKRQKVTFTRL